MMNLYAVFTENTGNKISEGWIVMAKDEEEAKAKAVKEGESWHHPAKYTATNAVFLRETVPSDTQAMEYLEVRYIYSWERDT